jgi:adenosine deaminase
MELVRSWSPEPIPEQPEWQATAYRYESFTEDFMKVMALTWRYTCNSLERLDEASALIYHKLFEQNVRYLEMSFAVGAYPYEASETLSAFKSNIPKGMAVRIIAGISRDRDRDTILEASREFVGADALDGVDLHGNETVGDPRSFVDLYETARSRGLILKAHAGELCGSESVEQVLDVLRVDRVEHGVRAIESVDLVRRCADEGITFDVCPWSNVKLGVFPDLKTHPVADLHRSGVNVTVSTDDPTPFGQTLTDEFCWLISESSMTVQEVGEIARNGFRVADLPAEARNKALIQIDQLVAEYDDQDA